ncbi:hypothetical protein AAC03nite_36670 [Alicyclobacillus acidoterrestris]|uniref:hypothetical protein n=1 Tax=Alicyclobacillus suci TaxID=2816080 RepID=UPI0011903A08|nr:hypothetical protein [Alicyclobacillus suci]GEO27882.1 hypothetical protein AAC03nite_36670 [Alicyclobacillus acidoterrestris]
MHERLRIHHGVGSRVLFDSDKGNVPFTYAQEGSGWKFTVQTAKTPEIDEVLRLKDEVNVFIFREKNGVAIEKVWFYTGDGAVDYSDEEAALVIVASRQIAYHPGDFEP